MHGNCIPMGVKRRNKDYMKIFRARKARFARPNPGKYEPVEEKEEEKKDGCPRAKNENSSSGSGYIEGRAKRRNFYE